MLIYTVVVLLLSSSQASLRSTRHHVTEEDNSFQDAYLEHLRGYPWDIDQGDFNDDDDDDDNSDDGSEAILQVLDAIRRAHIHTKREDSQIKPYENYDDKEDERKEKGHILNSVGSDIVNTHVGENKKKVVQSEGLTIHKDVKHVAWKDGKESVKDASDTEKKESFQTVFTEKRKKVEAHKDNVHKGNKYLQKKEHFDMKHSSDNIHISKVIDKQVQVETRANHGDNNQIASVKIDDSVERQQKLISKINPDDVFLEANANNTSNQTNNGPTHGHVKAPPPKVTTNKENKDGLDRASFIAVIAGCCVAGIAGIGLAGYCWFKLRQESNELKDVKGPTEKSGSRKGSGKKPSSEDDKLAQSAEVFHYLHAKKQMQQMGEPLKKVEKFPADESDDEEEDEDTVYECPGLAPPGDMKVVNPLFSDAESHHSDKHSDTPSQGSAATPTELESVAVDTAPPPQ